MRSIYLPGLLFLCQAAGAIGLDLPQESRVPGGLFILPIDAPAELKPTVLYEGSRALVVRDDNRWVAIVGLPLSTKPGTAEVLLQAGVQPGKPVKFEVGPKEYASQSLTVAPSQVNLSK